MRSTGACDAPPATVEDVWRIIGTELSGFVQRRIADPHRADDVISDIMLRIHTTLPRLREQASLTAWVFRIARNAIVDEYRRAGRDRGRPLRLVDSDDPLVDRGPDSASVVDELAPCLRRLLRQLAPEQRRAVELTDLGGLTQARAAATEGITVPGMKSRLQRGRRRLAVLLGRCCTLTLDARGVPVDYLLPPECGCWLGRGSMAKGHRAGASAGHRVAAGQPRPGQPHVPPLGW